MKAKVFKEANFDFKKPASMTEEQCYDLPTFRGKQIIMGEEFPVIISCWEVTDADLKRIQESKELWLYVTGSGMPPVSIQSEHPWINTLGEETAGDTIPLEKYSYIKEEEHIEPLYVVIHKNTPEDEPTKIAVAMDADKAHFICQALNSFKY